MRLRRAAALPIERRSRLPMVSTKAFLTRMDADEPTDIRIWLHLRKSARSRVHPRPTALVFAAPAP
jgi:hypothetical protein